MTLPDLIGYVVIAGFGVVLVLSALAGMGRINDRLAVDRDEEIDIWNAK